MKKSDYEMLSNEELQIMLSDQSAYSMDEIACVKEILKERNITGHIAGNAAKADYDREITTIPLRNGESERIKDIQNNIRIIRNCAIFFVIIAAIGLIVSLVCGINLISAFSQFAELAK